MDEQKKYPFLKDCLYRVEYVAVLLLANFARLLSIEAATQIAARFGTLSFMLLSKKRKTALQNLALAFPEKTEMERRRIACLSFENAAMSVTELFLFKKILREAEKRFDQSKTSAFDNAIRQGRGVILAISHLGAWECHEMLTPLKQTPTLVIVKNLKNPYVNRAINEMRSLTGVIPYDKDRAVRGIFEIIKRKGMAAILLDQWAGPDGIWIPFFGKETSTTTIAARLAQKTNAIIIPSFCIRLRPGYYQFQCLPEVTVEDDSRDVEMQITRGLNKILEEKIREYPEQWIWGHRRWKEKPDRLRAQ